MTQSPGVSLPGHRTGQKKVENGLGGSGVHRLHRITMMDLLSHTQNTELLRPLFSVTLAVILSVKPPKCCGLFFFSLSHKCSLKVMAGDSCNITVFIYSKIFIGHLLYTGHYWKRSHLPPTHHSHLWGSF